MDSTPQITIVTCLRDEGPFLVDWIAHLRSLGATRILTYTNDCRDGTEDLLDALAPAGVVHVAQGDVLATGGKAPQWRAMAAAWDHPVCRDADWLAHLDPDEYLALDGTGSLPDLIAALPEAEAIALPWRLFGCAGRVAPGTGSTPARFTRAAPAGLAYPPHGSFFKTLFRRDGPFTGFGIHRPSQSAPPVFLDDTGRRDDALARASNRIILWRAGRPPVGRRLQLNHYSTRSMHEFLVKGRRGLPNHTARSIGLDYWIERNFNEAACTMIAPQLDALDAEAARLRALPGVAAAEERTRARHDAALRDVLGTEDGARLYGHLMLAASSLAPSPQLGRSLIDVQARSVAVAS